MVDTEPSMRGPLHGVRVLELRAPGPVALAGTLLSDLGAEVLVVTRPGATPTVGSLDATWRGRHAMECDLKSESGRAGLLDLVTEADVLLEGFRPGAMERLGLGPESLLARNPRLIVGRMTGWGQQGPRSQTAGHDINYLALTGHLAAVTDRHGRPVPPLNLVADYGGGSMFLVTGVLSALLERATSGQGQVIDAAMVDGASMLGHWIWAMRGAGRWTDHPNTNMLDGGLPWYDVYETADGRFMAVGALEPAFYSQMVTGLGLATTLPDRNDRENWPAIRSALQRAFASHDMAHWCGIFDGTDSCVSPVLTYGEAEHDHHLLDRETIVEIRGVRQPAPAPRFSRTPTATPQAPVVHQAGSVPRWRSSSAGGSAQ